MLASYAPAGQNFGPGNTTLLQVAAANPPGVALQAKNSPFLDAVSAMLPPTLQTLQRGMEGTTVSQMSLAQAVNGVTLMLQPLVIYRVLFEANERFLTNVMAPITMIDALQIQVEVKEYFPGLVVPVAEKTHGQVGSWKFTSWTATMDQYAVSMRMSYQLMQVAIGREIMAYQLKRTIDSWYDFMNAAVLAAYLDSASLTLKQERTFLAQGSQSGNPGIFEMVADREKGFFDVLHKKLGLKILTTKVNELMTYFGGSTEGNVWLMSKRIMYHVNNMRKEMTVYKEGGQEAVDRVNRLEPTATNQYDNDPIFYIPEKAMFNTVHGLQLLQRRVNVGAYFRMTYRPSLDGLKPNLAVDPFAIEIYSHEDDCDVQLQATDALNHSGLFDRKTGRLAQVEGGVHTTWHYKVGASQALAASYIGQIEPEYLGLDKLKGLANRLAHHATGENHTQTARDFKYLELLVGQIDSQVYRPAYAGATATNNHGGYAAAAGGNTPLPWGFASYAGLRTLADAVEAANGSAADFTTNTGYTGFSRLARLPDALASFEAAVDALAHLAQGSALFDANNAAAWLEVDKATRYHVVFDNTLGRGHTGIYLAGGGALPQRQTEVLSEALGIAAPFEQNLMSVTTGRFERKEASAAGVIGSNIGAAGTDADAVVMSLRDRAGAALRTPAQAYALFPRLAKEAFPAPTTAAPVSVNDLGVNAGADELAAQLKRILALIFNYRAVIQTAADGAAELGELVRIEQQRATLLAFLHAMLSMVAGVVDIGPALYAAMAAAIDILAQFEQPGAGVSLTEALRTNGSVAPNQNWRRLYAPERIADIIRTSPALALHFKIREDRLTEALGLLAGNEKRVEDVRSRINAGASILRDEPANFRLTPLVASTKFINSVVNDPALYASIRFADPYVPQRIMTLDEARAAAKRDVHADLPHGAATSISALAKHHDRTGYSNMLQDKQAREITARAKEFYTRNPIPVPALRRTAVDAATAEGSFTSALLLASRGFLTRFHKLYAENTDPLQAAMAVLYMSLPFVYSTVHALYDTHVGGPLSWLVLQPAMRLIGDTVIKARAGPDTASSYTAFPLWTSGNSPHASELFGTLRMYHGVVVKQPNNVRVIEAAMITGYLGGGGAKPYQVEQFERLNSVQQMEDLKASLFFVPQPLSHPAYTGAISIDGLIPEVHKLLNGGVSERLDRSYFNSEWFQARWKLHNVINGPHIEEQRLGAQTQAHSPFAVMRLGAHRVVDPATGKFDTYQVESKGFWDTKHECHGKKDALCKWEAKMPSRHGSYQVPPLH